MKRNHIDYGIDLGTTNSAIARMEGGEPVIRKSSDFQGDTTPSAVAFFKGNRIRVGMQALNQLYSERLGALKDWDHQPITFTEFKRTMGTDERYRPASAPDTSYSSEELSAEVLKKLGSYASDETVHAAIITIPAAFKVPQQQATHKAAELAGFKQIQLLQEPVAAAMAYGLKASHAQQKWLVFDFGGGTFDAALVLAQEGVITVKDTEGDNFLGGKDLDMAVVDQLILPAIRDTYSIESYYDDRKKLDILRKALKKWGEEVNIQLSFQEIREIFTDLDEIPLKDEDDEGIELDFEITRAQLAPVVEPVFQRAIDKVRALLDRQRLKGSDLDELILVGGSTFSPILRQMLVRQIREPNTTVDPMTVVAQGAALFASTLPLKDKIVKQAIAEDASSADPLRLDVDYEGTTVEQVEWVTVKFKDASRSARYAGLQVELKRIGWTSGRQPVTETGTLFEVPLETNKGNEFTLVATNAQGNRVRTHPESLTIIQGLKVTGSSLPNSLGVEIESSSRRIFRPLEGAEKNRPLPVTGIAKGLRTPGAIRPGTNEDSLRISIYEGNAEAPNRPIVCSDLVMDGEITGEDAGRLIPADTELELTVRTQTSSSLPERITVRFPTLDNEELEVRIPDMRKSNDGPWFERELAGGRKLLRTLRIKDQVDTAQLEKIEKAFDECAQLREWAGSDRGEKEKSGDRLREAWVELDKLERRVSWTDMQEQLAEAHTELVKVNKEKGDAQTTRDVAALRERMNQVNNLQEQESNRNEDAERLLEEIQSTKFGLERLEFAIGLIVSAYRNFDSLDWKDTRMARFAVAEGMRVLQNNPRPRLEEVEPIVQRIVNLLVRPESAAGHRWNIPKE